jgi:hypothetical protein
MVREVDLARLSPRVKIAQTGGQLLPLGVQDGFEQKLFASNEVVIICHVSSTFVGTD